MSDFVHRDNTPLASIDSICVRCFRTVGTRSTEPELAYDEMRHICDAMDLARLNSAGAGASRLRHQCLIYDGPPSRQLPAVVAIMRTRLAEGHRCLALDSPPMIAGMRSYLAAAGVDVDAETARGSLVLTSGRDHLADGESFDIERMMDALNTAVEAALADGYKGLWATGDIAWEFGPRRDFSMLRKYEQRLDDFIRDHAALGGICQYHRETLPGESLRDAAVTHPWVFLEPSLSLINPHYGRKGALPDDALRHAELDGYVDWICRYQQKN